MKHEYAKHLKAMTSSLSRCSLVLILGFVGIDIVCSFFAFPVLREHDTFKNVSYKYAVESNSSDAPYSKLFKTDNLITFDNGERRRMNLNVYVLLGNDGPIIDMLEQNEIAISRKAADDLGVDIGNRIRAEYSIYSEPVEYTIKAIIPYASDMYGVKDSRDFSFAIVGHSEELVSHTKGKTVYFLNESEYDIYMRDMISYTRCYDTREDLAFLRHETFFCYFVLGIVIVVFVVAIQIWMNTKICKEALKYYYDGFSVQAVRMIEGRDRMVFFGIPVLLEIAWIICKLIGSEGLLNPLICVIVALTMSVIFFEFIGSRKYGKAN